MVDIPLCHYCVAVAVVAEVGLVRHCNQASSGTDQPGPGALALVMINDIWSYFGSCCDD